MDDDASPGGKGGGAVVEDAARGCEEDLVFAGEFEEEEGIVAGHRHPAHLPGNLVRLLPFFLQ